MDDPSLPFPRGKVYVSLDRAMGEVLIDLDQCRRFITIAKPWAGIEAYYLTPDGRWILYHTEYCDEWLEPFVYQAKLENAAYAIGNSIRCRGELPDELEPYRRYIDKEEWCRWYDERSKADPTDPSRGESPEALARPDPLVRFPIHLLAVEISFPVQGLADTAPAASPRYRMGKFGEVPIINGEELPLLTPKQFDILFAIRDAGSAGLDIHQLEAICGGARKTLKHLLDTVRAWNTQVLRAKKKGGRYRWIGNLDDEWTPRGH